MQLAEATILLVEDEPVVCEIMSVWLERAGSRVFTAANGAKALELLATQHVDLMISDLQMPVMDGITLLKRIHTDGGPCPVVIFITGYSNVPPRDVYDLGAEALLEKPIERDQLLETIQRSLMDRNSRWRTPMDAAPQAVLHAVFDSLASALREQRIAFGHGGFCIESSQPLSEGPIGFNIEFRDGQKRLKGQGIVRWTSLEERLAGIELMHVDDENRAWMAELAERNKGAAFIPHSAAIERVASE
jgi:CheY-like chemotaxis protein